jgi:hypothetical protein
MGEHQLAPGEDSNPNAQVDAPEIAPHPVAEVTKVPPAAKAPADKVITADKADKAPAADKTAPAAADVAAASDADQETPAAAPHVGVVEFDTSFYNSYTRENEAQNVLVDLTHRRITWHRGYASSPVQYYYDAALDDLVPDDSDVRANKKGPVVFLGDDLEKPGNPYYASYFLYFKCANGAQCIRERYVESGDEKATRQMSSRGLGFHSIDDARTFQQKYLSGVVVAREKKEEAAGLVLSAKDWAADPEQKLLVAENTSKDHTFVLTSYTLSDCRGVVGDQCATAKPQTEVAPGHSVNLLVVAPDSSDEYGRTPHVSFSMQWTYEDSATHKSFNGAARWEPPVHAAHAIQSAPPAGQDGERS